MSQSQLGTVKHYIENQEEHHRVKTFEEEYRTFLEKHEIEFDDRYLLG